ncbi:hypothetical protein F1880_007048 [Penicillium rolfsii]|nr:hypothetical protein F1880_007048 [Penicillium rolfsii]
MTKAKHLHDGREGDLAYDYPCVIVSSCGSALLRVVRHQDSNFCSTQGWRENNRRRASRLATQSAERLGGGSRLSRQPCSLQGWSCYRPSKAWEQDETAKRGPPFATTVTSGFNVQMAHIQRQMVVPREASTIGILHNQSTGRRLRHLESLGPKLMVRRLAIGQDVVGRGESVKYGRTLRQIYPDRSLVWAVVGSFNSRLAARTGRSAQSGDRIPSF